MEAGELIGKLSYYGIVTLLQLLQKHSMELSRINTLLEEIADKTTAKMELVKMELAKMEAAKMEAAKMEAAKMEAAKMEDKAKRNISVHFNC